MLSEFIYSQPVKIYFGQGQFNALATVLADLGLKRCVLVCGPHFAAKAASMMQEHSEICAVFSAVEPNPQLSGIEETVRLARENSADAVIGIGGGSALDTAKFAAAVALGERSALDYYNGLPFPEKRLVIIAVPTTAGTGSEVTQVSVVSHGTDKKTINNPVFMPTAAIVDPELCATVPARTTMNTGLDAMAHALEGYWSCNHQPICDLMAIESVRIILENLEDAYKDGSNMRARSAMAYASLLGGLAFALPKTAASHACSYPLAADYHLPHGEACAFTLDSLVLINADERLEYLCRRVGLEDTKQLAQRIAQFKQMGGLRSKLSDLENLDLEKLSRDCAAHPLMNNNPVKMDYAAVYAMFDALR